MQKSLKKNDVLTGIVKRHPDGFGFFISDSPDDPDVYVSRPNMMGVMTNDRVSLRIFPDRKPGKKNEPTDRWRGEIIEILKRATSRVVGVIHENPEGGGVIYDEAFAWGESLYVESKNLNEAEFGNLVAVDIIDYPDHKTQFSGKVSYLIGDAEDPLNDIKRVVAASGIPQEFSPKTLRECSEFGTAVDVEKHKERTDLRSKKFITIDGQTAKDFDDAIYVETSSEGFTLWVAIADVSHYVKPNTSLDEDAYERGTSVYLPNFVFPMLPEALSNELCSLKPHVARLAMTCEMKMSYMGEVEKFQFYESVIESHARVTYGEAQQILEGETLEKFEPVKEVIKTAADLAKILMAKRFKEGSLDLEIPETEVIVNEQGIPVDVVRSERIFAHRLIEELMLITNICAARFFKDHEMSGMFRIHEAPDKEAISVLERYMHNFGAKKKIQGGSLQKKLSRALQEFADDSKATVLNILTLRAMSQAKYSPENIGHFGLGFDDYSHFTSPIRRYPDLIVHRLIKSRLMPHKYLPIPDADLTTSGNFLSACEQRAVKAERRVISIKKARFMQDRVGEELDGVISSVAKFGVFVLLRQFDVDGRISMEALGDDFWQFDEENLLLRGKRSGKVYQIGDVVRVVVEKVDTLEGKIDFALAESPEDEVKGKRPKSLSDFVEKNQEKTSATSKHGKTNRANSKKRRPSKKNSGGVRSSRVSKRRGKN